MGSDPSGLGLDLGVDGVLVGGSCSRSFAVGLVVAVSWGADSLVVFSVVSMVVVRCKNISVACRNFSTSVCDSGLSWW